MSVLRNSLRIIRDGYQRLFRRQESSETREIIDTLRNVVVFQDLPRSVLRDLAGIVHIRLYKREEFLYYEGDPGLGLYVIQSGRVRLLIQDEEGGVHELRQVEAHDIFGYLSIVGEFRRIETAQAVVDTQVLGFFRPDLATLVKRDPKSGAAILLALARYLAVQLVEAGHQVQEREGKVAAGNLLHGALPPREA